MAQYLRKIRQELITLARIQTNAKVLDFGCGTATLTIMVKQTCFQSKVTGIDVDVEILEKAVQKVKKINWIFFYLITMVCNCHFKAILLTEFYLVFHHLDTDIKQNVLS